MSELTKHLLWIKNINKQIMKRSHLRSKFLNTKRDIDRKAYNTQRNLCVSLIRQAKKQFFSSLNTNVATKNKTFWKTLKPFLIDKVKTKSKITLIEKKNTRIAQQNLLKKLYHMKERSRKYLITPFKYCYD